MIDRWARSAPDKYGQKNGDKMISVEVMASTELPLEGGMMATLYTCFAHDLAASALKLTLLKLSVLGVTTGQAVQFPWVHVGCDAIAGLVRLFPAPQRASASSC